MTVTTSLDATPSFARAAAVSTDSGASDALGWPTNTALTPMASYNGGSNGRMHSTVSAALRTFLARPARQAQIEGLT